MLHITDGESVAGTLRESGVPGQVAIYGDLMYEGPTPAGLDAEAWREMRAHFMADSGYRTLEEARQYLKKCEDALAAYSEHAEVVIWLDHRLSDQLILIKVLDWFTRQDLDGVKLMLICVGHYPGVDRYVGLGQLNADQLMSLADTRLPIGEAQYRTAAAAWNAFTSPDPRHIVRFIESDTSALRFIAAALRRHLEQFPSLDNGLSRTERQALSVLQEHDSLSGPRLFAAVQRMEEQIFMGHESFNQIVADLAVGRHPLVQSSSTSPHGLGDVKITETGRMVFQGRADHIELNGIDRWLGGVHLFTDSAHNAARRGGKSGIGVGAGSRAGRCALKGEIAPWRWDRTAGRIVSG
jgi:Domain of unknown function (DUF1835)